MLQTYPLNAVRIAPQSVFAPNTERMLNLARKYPVDRLLAVFRANAGIDTRGATPPGNWEGYGHPQEQPWSARSYPGREQAQTANLLRGHYAGHFLSMFSLAYATTGEEELAAKVNDMVSGLAEVQRALAQTGEYSHPGFLAAYGEWQFSRLEGYAPYGEIWAPYYTTHKIMAGLLDAYELTGNAEALDLVTAMGHWVHGRLEPLSHNQRQKMWSLYIAGEYGGMNETLARLSVAANEPLFVQTASFFDQDNLLAAGSQGRDILDGMHANQHIPQLIGYARQYEVTGERHYLDAAAGIFGDIVPGRTYAHGGSGESELWGPADTVAGDIGNRNAETCVAYNLIKLARVLFAHTQDPDYSNYAERALLNQIVGSRKAVESDDSPQVTYMFGVHPGAVREFDNIGTCCGGTGLENHVKYGEGQFSHGAGELWVHHLMPATLDRAQVHGAGSLSLQIGGSYPYGQRVSLTFDGPEGACEDLELHVRIPEQASDVSLTINGEMADVDAHPGRYLTVVRGWRSGDVIEVNFDLALRSVPTLDDPALHHVELGPTVLVARSEQSTQLGLPLAGQRLLDGTLATATSAPELLEQLRTGGTISYAGLTWEAANSGAETRYHMYLRQSDPVITFAGAPSQVPNRLRPNGFTVLDSIWAGGPFDSREDFLNQVAAVVWAGRKEGVLSRAEAEAVLELAAMTESTAKTVDVRFTDPAGGGAELSWEHSGEGAPQLTWVLPEHWQNLQAPPIVNLSIAPQPAPSGWYTSIPQITITAGHVEADGDEASHSIEYSIDEGPWQAYTGDFALDQQGTHHVRARVTDAQGNQNLDSAEVAIDTEAPTSQAKVRELGSSVEITFTANDDVSGVDRIQWEGPGTFWGTFAETFVRALSDTEQVLEFAATDRAGNTEPRQRLVLPARD